MLGAEAACCSSRAAGCFGRCRYDVMQMPCDVATRCPSLALLPHHPPTRISRELIHAPNTHCPACCPALFSSGGAPLFPPRLVLWRHSPAAVRQLVTSFPVCVCQAVSRSFRSTCTVYAGVSPVHKTPGLSAWHLCRRLCPLTSTRLAARPKFCHPSHLPMLVPIDVISAAQYSAKECLPQCSTKGL